MLHHTGSDVVVKLEDLPPLRVALFSDLLSGRNDVGEDNCCHHPRARGTWSRARFDLTEKAADRIDDGSGVAEVERGVPAGNLDICGTGDVVGHIPVERCGAPLVFAAMNHHRGYGDCAQQAPHVRRDHLGCVCQHGARSCQGSHVPPTPGKEPLIVAARK